MPCYHPLRAFKTAQGAVVFVERGDVVQTLDLPCGQCIGCRLERSRQWAMRIMHEAQLHRESWFVTLTYEEERTDLCYADFQAFMRRLRRARKKDRIRFYVGGEYGSEKSRPHWHAILFGLSLPDRKTLASNLDRRVRTVFDFDRNGGMESNRRSPIDVIYWLSPELERIWSHGFVLVGNLTFESAAYTARYVVDKVNGDRQREVYRRVDADGVVSDGVPEMSRMSLKPGIGAGWLEKYGEQALALDRVVIRGAECNVPKYYLRKWKDQARVEEIKYTRLLQMQSVPDNMDWRRLPVKEKVAKARISFNRRHGK